MGSPARGLSKFTSCRRLRIASPEAAGSEFVERHYQQIHGEDPNQDDLPEPQIARGIVVRGHLWIAIEEPFPNAEDVEAAEENAQRENRISVLVKDGQARTHPR